MTLAALIAAYHEADDPGGGLRATLPVAGRTVVERQARLAAAAGAEPVIVAVERVTASLAAALDRLRGEGLEIVVARSATEAADAVEADSRLLLVADGLLASETAMERLVSIGGHAILTVPDVKVDDRYERIDAESRWAGLAMIDGRLLKQTAEMLHDWDLQSTLLRRAVQAGARQLSVRGEAEEEMPVVAETADDLAGLEAQILAGAHMRRPDWVSRYLLGPVESALTKALMPSSVTALSVALAETLLMVLSGMAFAWHWLGLGLLLFLLATPLEGVGERLASLRLEARPMESWRSALLPLLSAGILVILASTLAATRGWGCVALAGTTLAFLAALRVEAEGREIPGSAWLAEPKGMAWLLVPFALFNWWGTGLTALAVYAGASFFWAQRHAHSPLPPAAAED